MKSEDADVIEKNRARPSYKSYRIGSYYSNSMKSSNPHSGIYETELSNTLDNVSCGNPTCNQGGIVIVQTVKKK